MSSTIFPVLKRDLLLAYRNSTDIVISLFFFIVVVALIPISLNETESTLPRLAPGLVWIAALLSSILSLHRLFAEDHADGSLDLLLSSSSVYQCVLAKIAAHWLVTGLPLTLISPVIGLAYNLHGEQLSTLFISLLVGTPVLSCIGAIGAAMTIGLRSGSSLIALIVLPLNIPVMVYGSAAVRASINSPDNVMTYLLLLTAMLIIALVFAPLATAAALKISND